MSEKEGRALTCIRCPRGCRVVVTMGADGRVAGVTGNACRRGESYALAEVANPVRTVTTTVPVEGGGGGRVPVKTSREVPKAAVLEVMRAIGGVRAKAPVEIGDVIARDVAGTGANLVATGRAR